jgi:SAM-dependent methyltransferase
MTSEVSAFYDDFSRRFVEDIVQGNDRIHQQLLFFSRALPPNTQTVLVIGSGSGQGPHFIATIAKQAKILAVDISKENLRLARNLFAHPRVEYRHVDVTAGVLEGEWDAIVLPDVYEHIPKDARRSLHQQLARLLKGNGRILFTIPSPGKQASLYASGVGLQIVDEVVTLEDLVQVAKDVGGDLTFFNMVSVWETNDYAHAVIERKADFVRPMNENDKLPLKGWPPRTLWHRGKDFLGYRFGFYRLSQNWRRRRINQKLARTSS